MTRHETIEMLKEISVIYPSFAAKTQDPEKIVQVWQRALEGFSAPVIREALTIYFRTERKGFPPTPGALIGLVQDQLELYGPSENEVWGMVVKAVSRGIYNAAGAFDSLPEEVRRIIGSPAQIHDWAMMDAQSLHTTIGVNFRRTWRETQERRRNLGLPPALIMPKKPAPDSPRLNEKKNAEKSPGSGLNLNPGPGDDDTEE